MATKPMNLVDAVADTIPRIARNRSAVMRFGKVTTVPANGLVKVTVGTGDVTCAYLHGVEFIVNDWVALMNDGDRWLVLGKVMPTDGMDTGGFVVGDHSNPSGDRFEMRRAYSYMDQGVLKYKDMDVQMLPDAYGGVWFYGWVADVRVMAVNFAAGGYISVGYNDSPTWAPGSDVDMRPLPFAISAGTVTIPVTGTNVGSATMGFQSGRFTQTPVVTTGPYTGAGASATMYQVRHYTGSPTGMTYGVRNDGVNWTGDVIVHFHAIQMSSAAAPGRAMPLESSAPGVDIRQLLATCHEVECENFEKPLALLSPADTDYVICGPCGTHYEDVVLKGVVSL